MTVPAFTAVHPTLPAYELSGPPSAPVVVALGGISAGRHVASWWDGISGTGRALDTRHLRVLGIEFLDGGRGDDGRPQRIVSTHDQADALALVLDELGIEYVHAVVGASYGGMVALAFAERYPTRLQRLVVLGAAHEADANATALRLIQRRTVELGLDTGRAREALVLARALAMTTYRGERELSDRFALETSGAPEVSAQDAVFPIEQYLRHAGERFASTFAPERFLALSLSADLHRVNPERIYTPTTIVAFEGDRVVPRRQTLTLAARLGTPLTEIEHIDIGTPFGHDGFLLEAEAVNLVLSRAIDARATSLGAERQHDTHKTHTITQFIRSNACLA